MNKLALHICCGPCAMYPMEYFCKNEPALQITGLYYNPNIHPHEEFVRRGENVAIMAEHYKLHVDYFDDYMEEEWRGLGPATNPERCAKCYSLRLRFAAKYAHDNGLDGFSTTLLVSPYQRHEQIIKTALELEKEYGVAFYYKDFREGFRKGQQLARDIGLYRQKYCGCCWSLPEVRDK